MIRRAGEISVFFTIFLTLFAHDSFSLSQFSNYQSTTRVNDIVSSGLKTWAASSGGLFVIDFGNNSFTLYNDINHFPDVNLTAICRDPKGNLWIGSSLGYLYKQTPDGQNFVYDSYFGANWEIQALFPYKDYLIVGSTKGASIFDPLKEQALQNTSAIDTFNNPAVFSIAVHNDSLYLGCNDGFATAYIAGDKFTSNNYGDPSLWRSTPTGQPVVSFIDSSGVLLPQSVPATMAGQTLFYASNTSDVDSFVVKAQDSAVFNLSSAVTKLVKDDNNDLWIGTAGNYLSFWNKMTLSQITIPGLTYNEINRVYPARNGTVWLEPLHDVTGSKPEQWWDGIASFNGKTWTLYNQYTAQNCGPIGDDANFHGICEDRTGNMWFGAPGGGIKRLNVSTGQWTRYYMSGWFPLYPDFLETNDTTVPLPWEKCDAIAQDSSGFLWFANWEEKANSGNIKGCLICTDSSVKNYRRFYPYGDSNHIKDIISLCVDSRGKILAGGADGELLIASPNNNPLQNGIGSVFLFRNDLVKVSGMCATSNGVTWIATAKGLYKYNSVAEALDSIPTSVVPATINSVQAESDGLLWLGTSADGIIRYTVSDSTKITFNMGNGLVSNSVNDLSIDKTGGYLWAATTAGLSRMNLGHTSTVVNNNKNIIAYPNPFSQTNPNHREIVFKHCAPDIKIYIYSIKRHAC